METIKTVLYFLPLWNGIDCKKNYFGTGRIADALILSREDGATIKEAFSGSLLAQVSLWWFFKDGSNTKYSICHIPNTSHKNQMHQSHWEEMV